MLSDDAVVAVELETVIVLGDNAVVAAVGAFGFAEDLCSFTIKGAKIHGTKAITMMTIARTAVRRCFAFPNQNVELSFV